MAQAKNDLLYETIIMGFYAASVLMRHRTHISGTEHLKALPKQVVFAITHDSYFEIPALSNVYKAIKPRPVFTIMAKEEFLGGRYLSTNFFKDKALLRNFFKLIDRTGAPKKVFEKLNMISIPRPFADTHDPKYQNVRNQISQQLSIFENRMSEGFSTLIFPEGTTWGYGGLRKMRSAVYQLVSTSYEHCGREVHILPINVKADRLVSGKRDIFINVGKPQFFLKPKEAFNQQLFQVLQSLHTITFSQLAAYYLHKLADQMDQDGRKIYLSKAQLIEITEKAANYLLCKVETGALPEIDPNLKDRNYLEGKTNHFLTFCVKKGYLKHIFNKGYQLNHKMVLATYPHKLYRKRNPVGFHANELASLGPSLIEPAFE